MLSKVFLPIVLVALWLDGCSGDTDKTPQDRVLLDAAKVPLDKAREVEQQTLEAAEAQRRQIEEESR
ncbi:hypothetical protein SAMN02949497_1897 [Methylomagnum ishizawai]|uniref:Uncharacterized protein n=1 Tax=Methylomagnum ishizawai TaxID=1760988 RepID=A0A1Y6CVC3_9GAMM|nr:hypothetical protein [Methylomagnum ishizawai]SMF94578.1 hypothetical protein SAMN02949497_1897 [Methylomagnum ishizawai]